jgi:hypothetical protein
MTPQMIYLSNKKRFFRFLKEEGAYVAFKRNFSLNYLKEWFDNDYKQIVNGKSYYESVKKIRYISEAFYWKDTPEGFDYWNGLNIKWVRNVFKEEGFF